ncbi:hypothetical protein T492DRAFT_846295 [Pavlovales sp. CCMP2436]|nr:hypothetical protein T492DRAFT_846295 [Pavlovales sp. CCMP2436]
MSPLGTLAMKAIPPSQLQDLIRLEVKWASQVGWGTYDTAGASASGCTVSNIKLHVTQRTKAGMIDYRFRLGSMVVPQSPIDCTGSAAEARFELARTFGGGILEAAARSSVSAAQYTTDGGYAIGISLQAIPQSDSLSDGVSTQLMHVVFEAKIAADNPALYVDVWVQHEKILIAQNGLLTYES